MFHHDNASPHTSILTRQKLWELGWEVLMHPPYSPDLAPSDYHLFLAFQNFLSDKKLGSRKDCDNRLLEFSPNEDQVFYGRGIMKLPLNWKQIIQQNSADLTQIGQFETCMDFEEGKQGGTWLAMNTHGQVATLLNLMRPLSDLDGTKKDRGFLAVNFLESGMEGVNYLQRLRREADMYNSFLLVTIDVKPMMGDVAAAYYTNDGDEGPVLLKKGVHVFGNSSPSHPWKKVNAAKQMFEEVVAGNPSSTQKEELIADIFQVLRNDTLHYPDEQLDKDTEGRPEEYVKQLSAIFIKPEMGFYGSRTHTVILIDSNGHVDYVEKTMKEPIDVTTDITWVTTRMQFTIQDSSRIVSHL
ncbi:transport and Golgi organization protein 2 homolog [Trichonephila clavipes]|nr:transport and Golgi organization protein 2 homolog [Trichonephila clavipes]